MLLISDELKQMETAPHEMEVPFSELEKQSARVLVLAEMLWKEVEDYQEVRRTVDSQWEQARMRRWKAMSEDEQEECRSEFWNHFAPSQALPSIGVDTRYGEDGISLAHITLEGKVVGMLADDARPRGKSWDQVEYEQTGVCPKNHEKDRERLKVMGALDPKCHICGEILT